MTTDETISDPKPQTIIIRPDEGEVLHAFGDTAQLKLTGAQTNGGLALALGTTPAGHGPPPHIHHHEDELFIIQEGSFRFLGEEGWSEPVGPGAVIYTPRGVRHTFQNCGTGPGRHWIIATPSGFERFFGRCAEVFAAAATGSGAPDMERILAISTEHGLEFVPPLVPM